MKEKQNARPRGIRVDVVLSAEPIDFDAWDTAYLTLILELMGIRVPQQEIAA